MWLTEILLTKPSGFGFGNAHYAYNGVATRTQNAWSVCSRLRLLRVQVRHVTDR